MNDLIPVISFAAVAVLIPVFIRIAPALKLMDVPVGRKKHDRPVPLVGGLVIFPVFIVLAIVSGFSPSEYWPLYTSILILLITGAVDDRYHLPAWGKFFVQFCAAVLIVVFGGAQIHSLGNLFALGDFGLGFMSLPFSLAAVMLLINAVNLMDGLDGLAAGSVTVMLGWVAFGYFVAFDGGMGGDFDLIVILIAAILGFLLYNMRAPWREKASVFLGDAGSLCLGLCLAWFAIDVAKHPDAPVLAPMSVAWVLAIPIWDTCAQFYRRTREGRHPFSPDRGHLHHHFVHAGFLSKHAVLTILLLMFLSGAVGVLWVMVFDLPLVFLTVTWIICLFAHMHISRDPDRYISFFQRIFFR